MIREYPILAPLAASARRVVVLPLPAAAVMRIRWPRPFLRPGVGGGQASKMLNCSSVSGGKAGSDDIG